MAEADPPPLADIGDLTTLLRAAPDDPGAEVALTRLGRPAST